MARMWLEPNTAGGWCSQLARMCNPDKPCWHLAKRSLAYLCDPGAAERLGQTFARELDETLVEVQKPVFPYYRVACAAAETGGIPLCDPCRWSGVAGG